jgi:hypothetical protein
MWGGRWTAQVRGGLPEDVADVAGFVFDLVKREAQRRQARGGMDLMTFGVLGLGGGRAVVAPAVGLDDQAEVGEVKVDLEAVDDLLGERLREAGGGGNRAEEELEVGVGEQEGVAVEEIAQRRTPGRPAWSSRAVRRVSGSTRSYLSASLTARSRRLVVSSVARSIRVWIGVVTGMLWRLVISATGREGRV